MSRITGAARIAGVIGWPVAHSRSPRLHNHWLQRYGIDGAYVPLPVPPGRLAEALAGLRAAGLRGANVTLPHKEDACALCDVLDPSAARAGAVNTLAFGPDGVRGSNTDGFGFLANLRAHGVDPRGPALVLGAGGSARAIAAALLDAGCPVGIANRARPRAEALAHALPGLRVLDWDAREAALADHALLVNATPLGMAGHAPLPLDLSRALPGLAVADIVYAPPCTALLQAAAARGLRTVGGLGMLAHQARAGFAAWFGTDPEVDAETLALLADDPPARPA